MTRLCQFGAGRIGQIHAANVAGAGASLAYVVDVNVDAAAALAARHGARVADAEAALSDPSVDAVIIASSTDTHADLIERAARVRKPIFCEKPVDLSMDRVERCVAAVRAAGVPVLRASTGASTRASPSCAAASRPARSARWSWCRSRAAIHPRPRRNTCACPAASSAT
jgi:myo-inositol 2-dehydrogenase/D-chiro-inositol 1-dehydrogenase